MWHIYFEGLCTVVIVIKLSVQKNFLCSFVQARFCKILVGVVHQTTAPKKTPKHSLYLPKLIYFIKKSASASKYTDTDFRGKIDDFD